MDAPDAHFDYLSLLVLRPKSSKSGKKIAKNVQEPKNQILWHEIEPNMWTIASFLLILLVIRIQTLENEAKY